MLANVRRGFDDLPGLMRTGLAIAALGGAIDIGFHVTADATGAEHGPVALIGHLVTLAGMVITLTGLFGAAVKRRPVISKKTTQGETG